MKTVDKMMESKFGTLTTGVFLGTICAGAYIFSVHLVTSLT